MHRRGQAGYQHGEAFGLYFVLYIHIYIGTPEWIVEDDGLLDWKERNEQGYGER